MSRTSVIFLFVVSISVGFDGRVIEAAEPESSQAEGVKIEENRAVVQRGYKAHKEGDKAVIMKEGDTKKVTILQCQCANSHRPCGIIVEPSVVMCEDNRNSFQCDIQIGCRIGFVIHVP